MKSIILGGMFFGFVSLYAIANVDAAGCGYGGRIEQNCPSADQDCTGDCGYPYRWPGARSCNPCGDACRPQTCHDKTYCGPLTPIFALLTRDCWMGSGCGERYWGDFYGDPPDACDPCDRCGNYTGRSSSWSGGGVVTGSKPCNCGGGQTVVSETVPMEGRVIHQSDRVTRQIPTPAKAKTKVTRQ
jgi:hypothetical protein